MLLTRVQIIKDFYRLRSSPEWAFKGAGRSETNYITHGYHRYPAKFIPNIVRKIINEYTKPGDLIVDPFGGCGTTLVEAKINGRKSRGFDINPVAKLITQAKITPIKPKTLENAWNKFYAAYHNVAACYSIINIGSERLAYWFDEVTLTELSRIYNAIKTLKNFNVRRFYFCAFSHILKNCSRWLMKSIKPTMDKNKIPLKPFEIFQQHLRSMMKKNDQFFELLQHHGNLNVEAKMYLADSTKELPLQSNSIDLVVTSPPYVTSYEYADLHQLSLLWFGNDAAEFKHWHRHVKDFNRFRKRFIGTSLRKSRKKEIFNSSIGETIVNRLESVERSTARSVAHYFSDMNKSFTEMFRFLKPGGKVCIIVGNTTLYGIKIINAAVVAEQMQNIDFHPVKIIKRKVTNKMITPWRDSKSGKFTSVNNPLKKRVYEFEYIVIMRK